jgi:hypothetical protein
MVACTKLVESLHRPTVLFKTKYVRELTTALVTGIRHMLTTDGYLFKTEGERKSIDNIVDLLMPFDDDEAVQAVKYLTSYQLPRLVGDEEPVRPVFLTETSTLFTHEYGRYIGRLNANHGRVTNRQKSLAFSILNLKRYLPALSKKLKYQSAKDLKTRLTTPGVSPDALLAQIERTVDELFPPGWDHVSIPSYSASNKSCFESSRGLGGTQDYIFDPKSQIGTCGRNQIVDFRSAPLLGTDDVELPYHPNCKGREHFELIAKRTQPYPLRAGVELVDDPLKCRPITKNNWNCNILKPLQKEIHTQLKSNVAFRLIGEKLTEEIISCIDRFPGSKYVSGDYKSATDCFHTDATEACLNRILGSMSGPLSKDAELMILAKRSLTGLTISSEHFDTFVMNRGQLMGSLLSFPILCIVNFAMWRHSTELSNGVRCNGNGLGGRFDHVLINGDDIGFAATRRAFELWKTITPQVGLSPSPGKNYYTGEFIMLNTLMFSWSERQNKLVSIRFVNLGLLKCPGEECIIDNLDALGQMHDDFVYGCSNKSAGSGVFISEQKELLKLSWRNLFGPRELGGLGAHPVKGSISESSEGYSVRQLIIAKLLNDSGARMYSSGLVGRYDAFQKIYLDRKFPDVCRSTEEKLPMADFGYQWEDVTELVGDASIDFLSMVSWLSPYSNRPRPVWVGMNRLKTMGSFQDGNGDWRHSKKCLPVSVYLEVRAEVFIFRKVEELIGPLGIEECFV